MPMNKAMLKDEIIKQVDNLSPDLQERVLRFAQSLADETPHGVSGQKLIKLAGSLLPDDVAQMTEAIERDCVFLASRKWIKRQ